MITNLAYIKKCFISDNTEKMIDCLIKNFSIEDDEFNFQLVAEVAQPLRVVAEKLFKAGRPDLVGDIDFIKEKKYLRKELRIRIIYESKFEDPWLGYGKGHFKFNKDGLGFEAYSRGNQNISYHKEARKTLTAWLKRKFGDLTYLENEEMRNFYKRLR